MAKTPGSGRVKGTPNKLTAAFKDGLLHAYQELGGAEGMAKWAKAYPSEFYRICAKLVPRELAVDLQTNHPPPLVIDLVTSREDMIEAMRRDDLDQA